ncbi:MAG: peptide-methionine (S)-S-oxide reductase MsrA [Bacteroidia bacterium]
MFKQLLLLSGICFYFTSCSQNLNNKQSDIKIQSNKNLQNMETATFGSGCFWCVEAIFQQLKGVEEVKSGYMGGKIKNPTYREVCSGLTGHAEVIQLKYNPSIISYKDLLEVFFQTHDPTTLNRQGADVGTQYRSVIFYHNENQKELAEKIKNELNAQKVFDNPIVTEISPATEFYIAEDYHQNYYNNNQYEPYCTYVIKPKMEKFKKVFSDKLK